MRFWVAVLCVLGFSTSVNAGCGNYMGMCTYIDANMSVRVSDEPCLILSCGNVTDVVAGMKFQNGATVIRDYSADPAIKPTANGMAFTELKSKIAAEGAGAFQTEEGEIFISRGCDEVAEGEIDPCDGFYNPQFWQEIGGGKFTIVDKLTYGLNDGTLQYLRDEEGRQMIYFQPHGDGVAYSLQNSGEFEYLSIDQVVDIDGDGIDEFITRNSDMGTCCAHIGYFTIYSMDENGKYAAVQSDIEIIATGDVKVDLESQLISYSYNASPNETDNPTAETGQPKTMNYSLFFGEHRIELRNAS